MNRKILLIAGTAAGIALACAVPARAQDTEKLTLRQAVTLALQNSRELALARVQ